MKKINNKNLIAILTLITGCATTAGLYPGTGEVIQIKNKTYDEIWRSAIRSVDSHLSIETADKEKGVIKARKYPGIVGWGEVIAVFISPTSAKSPEYSVEVVSKEVSGHNAITSNDWTTPLLDEIRKRIVEDPKELKSGH